MKKAGPFVTQLLKNARQWTMGAYVINLTVTIGFSGRLQVNDQSTHSIATNLVDMGLKNKKPFLVLYSEKARMILNEGIPIL